MTLSAVYFRRTPLRVEQGCHAEAAPIFTGVFVFGSIGEGPGTEHAIFFQESLPNLFEICPHWLWVGARLALIGSGVGLIGLVMLVLDAVRVVCINHFTRLDGGETLNLVAVEITSIQRSSAQ